MLPSINSPNLLLYGSNTDKISSRQQRQPLSSPNNHACRTPGFDMAAKSWSKLLGPLLEIGATLLIADPQNAPQKSFLPMTCEVLKTASACKFHASIHAGGLSADSESLGGSPWLCVRHTGQRMLGRRRYTMDSRTTQCECWQPCRGLRNDCCGESTRRSSRVWGSWLPILSMLSKGSPNVFIIKHLTCI